MSDKEVTAQAILTLEAAIAKANAAAERLVRCAESISNPVYSVSMQGHHSELQIQAVRHFQGQICITVANPFEVIPGREPKLIGSNRSELIEQTPKTIGAPK